MLRYRLSNDAHTHGQWQETCKCSMRITGSTKIIIVILCAFFSCVQGIECNDFYLEAKYWVKSLIFS